MAAAEQTVECDATQQACFDAIADFETYPEWQSAVLECEVRERDGEGRGTLVAFLIDAKVRKVRYVLRYHYDPPGRIWWDYVEGDVKHVEGEYLFEAAGDGRCRATYRLDIDPGRFLPGPVKKVLSGQVMKGSVEDLKRRVESA